MKKRVLKLMGLALLTMVFGACNNDDDTPVINPIIGEWVAAEGQFLTITVDGEEKSELEFGMKILRANEAGAELAAREYFQLTILGPIDIQEPKLSFSPSAKLIAVLSGQQVEGTWKMQNEKTILKVTSPDLNDFGYYFNLKKLTANELELDWNWEMSNLGETTEAYQVGIKIQLVK